MQFTISLKQLNLWQEKKKEKKTKEAQTQGAR